MRARFVLFLLPLLFAATALTAAAPEPLRAQRAVVATTSELASQVGIDVIKRVEGRNLCLHAGRHGARRRGRGLVRARRHLARRRQPRRRRLHARSPRQW
jgi:hypothetical protein